MYNKSGTRPKVTKAFLSLANMDCDPDVCADAPDSNSASAIMAGPSVINRNNSEGGYLVVLKNESTVNMLFFCRDHFAGSPYTLISRKTRNRTVAALPIASNTHRRQAASF